MNALSLLFFFFISNRIYPTILCRLDINLNVERHYFVLLIRFPLIHTKQKQKFNCVSFIFIFFENIGRADKLDNSFSRSRSSSMSSLENITSESVTCLAFVDSYTKKSGKFLTFFFYFFIFILLFAKLHAICFTLSQLNQFILIYFSSLSLSFSLLFHIDCFSVVLYVFVGWKFLTHCGYIKIDPSALIPTLWLGTSLGSVLTVSITLPEAESRNTSPVLVSILGMSTSAHFIFCFFFRFFFSIFKFF